ncbi:MAG: cupredoxin domain-containing protein [Candidatus Saccharimonadales bacterium]
MKKLLLILVAVALVAVAGWFIFSRNSDQEQSGGNGAGGESVFADEAIITYTDSGFSPSALSVTSGTTVIIVNESGEQLDFSSSPHPVHSDNPELNRDTLSPGESDSFILTEPGTWGYHNHLNPDKTGTITVE